MANPEHVEIVRRGRAAIPEWRQEHPREQLDLLGAHLSRADLSGADLSGADLGRADLTGAHLSGAYLGGANLMRAALNGVGLTRADLSRAVLFAADLGEADLGKANLSGANLSWADMSGADLSVANLSGADLSAANLRVATLSGAKLHRADLREAHLNGAVLRETDLSDARCGYTAFAGCDLSQVRSLETVDHWRPSTIGVDTLAVTLQGAGGRFTAEQRTFFENAGVPRALLDYLPDLLETEPIQFFSCFVSYGGEDAQFAQCLYDDLRSRGIRCWKYDVDAIVGREVWANISRAIVVHEKMIVICSGSSLERPGVLGEIERALQKEEQLKRRQTEMGHEDMDADVLVPVRLDSYVLEEWDHPRAADVRKKHIGDFCGWENDAKYEEAFEQLLRALDPRSKLGLSKGDLRELRQD